MKTVLLLIILSCISYSNQHQLLPNCVAKDAEKTYDDILIVFIIDHSNGTVSKLPYWYFIKQVACEIPVAINVQTYILDYQIYDWNEVVTEASFTHSRQLVADLNTNVEKPLYDVWDNCGNLLLTTAERFYINPVYKKHRTHKKVKTVFFSDFTRVCEAGVLTGYFKGWEMVLFSTKQNGKVSYFTSTGEGVYDPFEQTAPQNVVDAARELVKLLVEEEPSISEEEEQGSTGLTVAVAVGCVLASLFLIIATVFFILTLRMKKDKNMNKVGESIKTNSKQ